MESFSPQGRRAPEPFSVRLREGASPHLRRGAMAALRLRLSLGAPFTTMVQRKDLPSSLHHDATSNH